MAVNACQLDLPLPAKKEDIGFKRRNESGENKLNPLHLLNAPSTDMMLSHWPLTDLHLRCQVYFCDFGLVFKILRVTIREVTILIHKFGADRSRVRTECLFPHS